MVLTYDGAMVRPPAWFALALALALAGCGDDRPPVPHDAAQACFAAMDAFEDQQAIARPSLACPRLYRDDACRDAWGAVVEPGDPAEIIARLQAVRDHCRRACLRLSRGSPPRSCLIADDRYGLGDAPQRRLLTEVMEIDRGLHELTGFPPDEAARLSTRAALVLAAAPPPDPDPPAVIDMNGSGAGADDGTIIDLKQPSDALVIELTSTGIKVHGLLVNDRELRAALAAHAGGDPDAASVMIQSPQDVPYQRVVDLLDIVRASGIDQVVFKVDRP